MVLTLASAATAVAEKIGEAAITAIETVHEGVTETALETIRSEAATLEAQTVMEKISFEGSEGMNIVRPETTIRIETKNDHLEGMNHPLTGVPFESKTIELPDGRIIEGVYPQFESIIDCKLPDPLYTKSDFQQFSYANEQLSKAIEENPKLSEQFNDLQLEQIRAGETPDGYTWHHNEQPGNLQLVNEGIHVQTGHSGGRNLWGGGTICR